MQAHGGDIFLVSYLDGILTVKLSGACTDCPMSWFTLKEGIEKELRAQLPELREVVALDEDE